MMTIQEMRRKKKERGYTYAQISRWSGVPVGTLQKIFRGETESPRYETMRALERAFESRRDSDRLCEFMPYGVRRDHKYAVEVRVLCWNAVWDSVKYPVGK